MAIQTGSQDIEIKNNRFESISSRAGAINISELQTSGVTILGNIIHGASEWGYSTIKIGGNVTNINLTGNQIDGCYSAIYMSNSDSILIHNNVIDNSNYGVFVDNMCSDIEISANQLINIKSHPNVPDGTSGITPGQEQRD